MKHVDAAVPDEGNKSSWRQIWYLWVSPNARGQGGRRRLPRDESGFDNQIKPGGTRRHADRARTDLPAAPLLQSSLLLKYVSFVSTVTGLLQARYIVLIHFLWLWSTIWHPTALKQKEKQKANKKIIYVYVMDDSKKHSESRGCHRGKISSLCHPLEGEQRRTKLRPLLASGDKWLR